MDEPQSTIKSFATEHDAPREIELKLELAPDDIDALLTHPLLAQAMPLPDQSGVLFAVYYDTADQALRHAGMTLRIRRKNGRDIQTIKVQNGVQSLALDRAEWECDAHDGINFEAAAQTPLASFIADEKSRKQIKPAFTVDTIRHAFLIEHEGATIECALDQVTVSAGSQILSFSELELELKDGKAAGLFGLLRNLTDIAPLRLSLKTKSERGYALTGAIAQPAASKTIDLPPHTSCAAAFQIIARSCLSQIVQSEALFRQTRDAEALHQMRVGFRRLKAAFSLFKDMLNNRESKALKEEIRWAGKQLGPARDLDVLITRLQEVHTEEARADLARAERQHTEAYGNLLEALSSPRFIRAILQTASWIEAGQWLTRGRKRVRQQSIEDLLAEELLRHWKPIRKKSKKLAALEPERRHKVRIRAKKLRYITEFVQSLFQRKPAKKRHHAWLAHLKDLQDFLGEMNDIAVGSDQFPSLVASNPKQAKRREKKLLSKAQSTAWKLRQTTPFWT